MLFIFIIFNFYFKKKKKYETIKDEGNTYHGFFSHYLITGENIWKKRK